ncbi:UDP-glucuronosyltransferase 2A1-like [Littorina saxatilis]|uniref:UDP-glucuronosyltransferase n=1 Tax=Littorina saxatilis TaxID=31220 RepID=A0AAN9BVT2_9CAEN
MATKHSPALPPWLAAVLITLTGMGMSTVQAKRVIMLPMPFENHIDYHGNVARALMKLGHEVWTIVPAILADRGKLDTSDLNVVLYDTPFDIEDRTMPRLPERYFKGMSDNYDELETIMKEHCERILKNHTFFKTLQHIKPDFVVIDNLSLVYMLVILPYKLGVPFAFVGSSYDPIAQRVPFSPAVTPLPVFPYSDHMTFFQRVKNTLVFLKHCWNYKDAYEDAVARFAPEKPSIPVDMLIARAEMWLVEMDHILDYPKPSLPNVKFIGGTVKGPAGPLPKEFNSFMDDALEGVVLVSFGKYVLGLPTDISDKLFEVFESLPMKVIFRSNLTSPNPSKIMTSTWLPQNDLLGHPNTKVFVSHCGKNGQYEALYHAVPVVATPLFYDQPYNAERMRVKGLAEVIDLRTSTAAEMTAAIMKVARQPRYKQAITAASRLFRQQFHVPVEVAARWLDHVMKYGGAYMRSAGQDLTMNEFLIFDVIGFLAVAFLVLLAGVLYAGLMVYRHIVCRKKKTE